MKRRTVLLFAAVLATTTLQIGASNAAGGSAASCVLAGTVHLNTITHLTNASQGSGQFSAATLTCVGSIVGTANISSSTDSFSFCKHGVHNASSPVRACQPAYQKPDPLGQDSTWDTVNTTTGQGLIAYFLGGPVQAGTFASGGNCSFNFHGNAIVTQAEIGIDSFTCDQGFKATSGYATASDIPELTPCGNDLCFTDIVFSGTIDLVGQ